jgi:tetratricopeptide (TPR) repeat protein
MPGVAHPAHMPSHIFIRTGYYNEGVDVNRLAIKAYNDYLGHYPESAGASPLYQMHNLHMEAACANMEGRFGDALKASYDTRASLDTSWAALPGFDGIFMQYVHMTPLLTQVRFGAWDDILNVPAPEERYVYAKLLWRYGRGLALARQQKIADAKAELSALKTLMNEEQLFAPAPTFSNPGINGSKVAEKILEGVIAEEMKNYKESIAALRLAVSHEDSMVYDEPRDWVHPARQYLGAVLIKDRQFKQAEKIFREDLVINPQNGWSYTGLWQALSGQKRQKEAAEAKQLMQKAFARADKKPRNAVF